LRLDFVTEQLKFRLPDSMIFDELAVRGELKLISYNKVGQN